MFFLFTLIFNLFLPNSALAQESTTPTTPPNKEVLQMVQQKVKDMLEQSDSTKTSTSPKSIIGTIGQISDTQITITFKNETKNITVSTDTVFIDAKKNKTKLSNLKSGQDLLCMGYFDSNNNFTAKRIVIIDLKTINNNNEIILGKIVDISKSSSIFSLTSIKNKDNTYQIKTDSKTEVVDSNNIKSTIDKLKSGQKIIVVIQPDIKLAKTFYVSKIITIDASPNSISPTPTTKK